MITLTGARNNALCLNVRSSNAIANMYSRRHGVGKLTTLVFGGAIPRLPTHITLLCRGRIPVIDVRINGDRRVISADRKGALRHQLGTSNSPRIIPLFISRFVDHLSRRQFCSFDTRPTPRTQLSSLGPSSQGGLEDRVHDTGTRGSLLSFASRSFSQTLRLIISNPCKLRPSITNLLAVNSISTVRQSIPTTSTIFRIVGNVSPGIGVSPFILPLISVFSHMNRLVRP